MASYVSDGDQGSRRSPADLFDLLWETLADVMGTAATATLLRRAARRATAHHNLPDGLVIGRTGLEYTYQVPEPWRDPERQEGLQELRTLVAELGPLLVELTGPVVVRRLQRIQPLQKHGICSAKEIGRWLRNQRGRPSSA